MTMERTLQWLAEHLHGRLIGDGAMLIRDISDVDAVRAGEMTFAEDARHLSQAIGSSASAVLVRAGVKEIGGKSGISVQDPKLAFALLLELFHPAPLVDAGVHPSAVLGADVQLGERVTIRANAVIGDRVRLGAGTIVEAGAVLGDGTSIGDGCFIGPNVVLYRETCIGNRVRIHGGSVIGGDGFGYVFHQGRYVKVPQVGNVVIEDDVELGCNVCVDRATIGSTIIRQGTKVDNLVQIAHNDRIGQHVILAGQVGLSGSVTIGDYTMLGGKAGVVDHVVVGDKAQVGAASVVTKAVAPGSVVWGYPARPIRETKQSMASLARLSVVVRRVAQFLTRLRSAEDRLDRLEQRQR